MLRAIVWGLMVGVGLQSWRNFPPDGPVTADAAAVVFVAGVVCTALSAFGFGLAWGSLRGRGGSATAVAESHSEATATAASESSSAATVNVAVVIPGGGAGQAVTALPWFAGEKPALDADALDGLDLADAGLVPELDAPEVSR